MRRILVFLKEPVPGKVKTRMAETLGAEAAAEVYRLSTELTMERLGKHADKAVLFVEPPEAIEGIRIWLGHQWHYHGQHGNDLGARLLSAMRWAFGDGAEQVLAIGTDSPWLNEEVLEDAFAQLEFSDMVLGPSEDGGYYLIGLNRLVPRLFEAIEWSTSSVLDQTKQRAHTAGLSLALTREGYDLDHEEDIEHFLQEEAKQASLARQVTQMQELLRRHSCQN